MLASCILTLTTGLHEDVWVLSKGLKVRDSSLVVSPIHVTRELLAPDGDVEPFPGEKGPASDTADTQ